MAASLARLFSGRSAKPKSRSRKKSADDQGPSMPPPSEVSGGAALGRIPVKQVEVPASAVPKDGGPIQIPDEPSAPASTTMPAVPDVAAMSQSLNTNLPTTTGTGPTKPAKSPKVIDRDFVEGVAGAELHGPKFFAYGLLFFVLLTFLAFIVWANWATLDEVTRGDGRIIPSSEVQVIQNLEGGIVAEILVREGQVVEKDEIFLRLENATASSSEAETKARYLALLGGIARLNAEIDESTINFPPEVLNEAPELADNETALFTSRQEALRSEIEILGQQAEQRQQEVSELDSRIDQLDRSFSLANQELRITKPLADRGIVSRVEMLRLEREVNDMRGQLEQAKLSRERAASALNEAQRRVDERRLSFRSEAIRERNTLNSELSVVKETLGGEADRVERTEIKSPVRGTIKDLKVTTIGGVVQPGEDLAEIVPLEDNLLVEAKIRPSDIAFLHPGLEATVKVTAYDFSIYGGLKGRVEDISADTIVDEQGEVFYRVRIRTDQSEIEKDGRKLPIIPGMTAQVDVLTGEKTVLDYILKPILKAKSNALSER